MFLRDSDGVWLLFRFFRGWFVLIGRDDRGR
jgi:hypothetical protein